MFLCNTVGVLLILMISLFHVIGVEKENHGPVIVRDWKEILLRYE
jgi:hypothetical protein